MRKGEDISDILYEILEFLDIQTHSLFFRQRECWLPGSKKSPLAPSAVWKPRGVFIEDKDLIIFQCTDYTGFSGKAFCIAQPAEWGESLPLSPLLGWILSWEVTKCHAPVRMATFISVRQRTGYQSSWKLASLSCLGSVCCFNSICRKVKLSVGPIHRSWEKPIYHQPWRGFSRELWCL